MAISINTNNVSLTAQTNLNRMSQGFSESVSRMQDRMRLTREPTLSGYTPSFSTAADALNGASNMASVIDGALESATDLLQRNITLALQASNGALNASDRESIGQQFSQVTSALASIAKTANFNGEILLDSSGTTPAPKSFVTGATADANGVSGVTTTQLDMSKVTLYSDTNAEDGILTRSYGGYHLVTTANTPASSKEIKITAETTAEEAAAMAGALKGILDGFSSARTTVGQFQNKVSADVSTFAQQAASSSQLPTRDFADARAAIDAAKQAADQMRQQMQEQMNLSMTNTANTFAILRGLSL